VKATNHNYQHRLQKSGQKGVALLMVLWIVSIMLMISSSLLYSVKMQTAMTYYGRNNAEIRAYSEAALRYSIQQLLLDPSLRSINILGKPFKWEFEQSQATISIVAENGLIDLNQAPRKLLQKLFIHVGEDEDKANMLLDLIEDFKDDDNLARLNGAEDQAYVNAGFAAGAKDAPFERLEELQQVMAISLDVYKKLEKYLTVNAQSKGVNPMLAPEHILMLLANNDTGLVYDYMEQRENAGGRYVQANFGEGFTSYTQQDRYRIHIQISINGQASYYLDEYSILLVKDKIPPFISYYRKKFPIQQEPEAVEKDPANN
jgi:general secretion pathway protein K